MCSATPFLLLVTFCGTVSSLWYPNRPCYGKVCPAIYCLYGEVTPPGKCCPQCKPDPSSNIHKPCYKDKDCDCVVCDNPWEEVECHDAPSSPTGRECHCHRPGECDNDFDCYFECGPGATCDDGACHGPWCDHT